MDNLTRIENGAMSGLSGLKELHISDNKFLTSIGEKSLGHNDTGIEIWPLVTKVLLFLMNPVLFLISNKF